MNAQQRILHFILYLVPQVLDPGSTSGWLGWPGEVAGLEVTEWVLPHDCIIDRWAAAPAANMPGHNPAAHNPQHAPGIKMRSNHAVRSLLGYAYECHAESMLVS